MNSTEFSIIKAVRGAYGFVWKEWKYLLRISLLPLGISAATQLFLYFKGADMSAFEIFIWGIPATALMAWFMFHESRLLLLGERAEALPQNAEYLSARKRSLNASVCLWLLFNMSWSLLIGYHEWALAPMQGDAQGQQEFWPIGLGAILFAVFFWSLRFGVAHILAAIEYPLSRYVRMVSGLGISFRLVGMGLMCLLPVTVLFGFVGALLMPEAMTKSTPQGIVIQITPVGVVLDSLLTFVVFTLINAAASVALRDVLNGQERSS